MQDNAANGSIVFSKDCWNRSGQETKSYENIQVPV